MIQTARDIFKHKGLKEAGDYRGQLDAAMIKRRAMGLKGTVVETDTPSYAEINNGRWTAECPCGASVATDPAWGVAGCFGCGIWQTTIVFPADSAAIEKVLELRPDARNQNWRVEESIEVLQAENTLMLTRKP